MIRIGQLKRGMLIEHPRSLTDRHRIDNDIGGLELAANLQICGGFTGFDIHHKITQHMLHRLAAVGMRIKQQGALVACGGG